MCLQKFNWLNKHSAGTTARVINAAVIKRFQYFHNGFNNAWWRVKFTAFGAFVCGKLGNAIFISAPEQVFILICLRHINIVGKKVNHIAQNTFIKVLIGIIFWQNIFKCFVFCLYRPHGFIYNHTDFRCMSGFCNFTPACGLRHIKYTFHRVGIFFIFKTIPLSNKLIITLFKGKWDVAQKNKPDDYLTIICRRNMSPQLTSRIPNLLFKTNIGVIFPCHFRPLIIVTFTN